MADVSRVAFAREGFAYFVLRATTTLRRLRTVQTIVIPAQTLPLLWGQAPCPSEIVSVAKDLPRCRNQTAHSYAGAILVMVLLQHLLSNVHPASRVD